MSNEITCCLMGGLGNQIFQIFATISCSINSNRKFFFSKELNCKGITARHTYWDTFFLRMKPFLKNESEAGYGTHILKEECFNYDANLVENVITDTQQCLTIYGYFQNEKYFKENYDTICKLIGLNTMKTNVLKKYHDLNPDLELGFDNSVSMHFRLGDYKKLQHYHPLMPYEYYQTGLSHIIEKRQTDCLKVLYFFEEEDFEIISKTISKLSEKYPNIQFVRVNGEMEDWEQLLLMSVCRDNIIANSSFSWWGAYFNSHEDKIVVCPSVWFSCNANLDTSGLCPASWHQVKL